jgi:trehalose 6-phosphate synthase
MLAHPDPPEPDPPEPHDRRSGDDVRAPIDRPIVIAANRLPVMRTGDGGWTPSPGGLVRALFPMLRESGGTWVGWTGDADDAAEPFTVDGVRLHPIGISAEEMESYYEGFSNDALWPLYHDALRESTFDSNQWDSYQAVNERFADTLADIAPPESVVWIHDYHLQLVPGMLRARRPDLTIGFFLHIPFPPVELFSRLPWRNQIIEGLLGCDLVGFQRPMGAINFTSAAHQLLAADTHDMTRAGTTDWVVDGTSDDSAESLVVHAGRSTVVGVFPISIDVAEVEEIAAGRATRQRTSQIRARLGDPEVIMLGVDRLDYTKGIGLRLRAFAKLLEDGRLDPTRHVMVQVATPTRESVEHYRDERREIERHVGEINGRFSRIGLPVVHYLYQSLPYDELVALYRAGDVMLVTPFRDGMNLVAKEYCAAHIDGDGVLVLSEFAGAADELTTAVLVNPHDDRALQDSIVHAVEMHRHERRERMAGLRSQIRKSDVRGWAARFLAALAATGDGSVSDAV